MGMNLTMLLIKITHIIYLVTNENRLKKKKKQLK